MSGKKENPIYDHNTLEFVTVAAEYCALLEKQGTGDKGQEEFVAILLKILPILYMKVQLLPEVDSDGSFAPSGQVTEDDYNFVRDGVYNPHSASCIASAIKVSSRPPHEGSGAFNPLR